MFVFKRLVTQVFLWLESVKGPKKVSQAVVIQTERANSLRVIHQSGYDITIYCQRKEFLKEYEWDAMPSRTYVVYYVFSRPTPDAPDLIQQACRLEVTFPPLVPEYVEDEIQKRAAIDAYVDLITDKVLALKQGELLF
jgi:hypothetical protein